MISQDQLAENCDKNNRMSFLSRAAARRFHVGAAERPGGEAAVVRAVCRSDRSTVVGQLWAKRMRPGARW